jgi:hypothetical protein
MTASVVLRVCEAFSLNAERDLIECWQISFDQRLSKLFRACQLSVPELARDALVADARVIEA